MKKIAAVFAFIFFAITHAAAATPQDAAGFATPLTPANLDSSAFADWVDGVERPIKPRDARDNEHTWQWVLWTQSTQTGHSGLAYGDSKTPGARHLRIGFTAAIPVGSVLVKGGGTLSVLKAGAVYPGDLGNDANWQPAQRLKDAQITSEEVRGHSEYGIWVLPPGTETRALRFTHTAAPADKEYSGWLGGAQILRERFANLAPQAIATTRSRNEAASQLNNGTDDNTWKAWDNGKDGAEQIVSPQHPEWVTLVWPHPVSLRAVNALWAGFSACDVQVFTGPESRHPREASDAEWQSVAASDKIENQYPRQLGPNWLDFTKVYVTRAVRLLMTKSIDDQHGHSHMKGNAKDGRRVWFGELMALQALEKAELSSTILAPVQEQTPPPIPVRFTLKEPGYVTLVIERPDGVRVRNLIAETLFPAGDNVVAWDGTDDLLRDKDAAAHGIFHIPAQFVTPGSYRVRGLVRKAIDLRYEFAVYNAGNPAWTTADHTGGWLANHSPPSSALFIPADRAPGGKPMVALGSYVTEGGDGLAYVDLDGKKLGGQGWVGGNWTGAPFLARDDGPNALPGNFAYAAAAWGEDNPKDSKQKRGEIRLTALTTITAQGNNPILKYYFTPEKTNDAVKREDNWGEHLGGIAVYNGVLVFSMSKMNELVFVDVAKKAVIGKAAVKSPRGVAFDAQGRLLVLSEFDLHRYTLPELKDPIALPGPEIVVKGTAKGEERGPDGRQPTHVVTLPDPQQIALAQDGRVLISTRGFDHQIKVYSTDGKRIGTIGKSGKPAIGKYDPEHLNDPNGITIDSQNRVWVAETNFQPKRVSVWSMDGKLLNAYYGPSEYGGGGTLDPQDKNRFYYHGMEFALNWTAGTSSPTRVFFRRETQALPMPERTGVPETPVYIKGQRYFSNCDNSNPTGGSAVAMLWIDRNDIAVPVAAMGRAGDWNLLKTDEFKAKWPGGLDIKGDVHRNPAFFVWSDLNGDGLAQPDEVTIIKARSGGMTVMPDLSFVSSRVDDIAARYAVKSFTGKGVPIYDLAAPETLATGAQSPTSSGGDQVLVADNGWSVLTVAPKPFAPQSMGGVFKGEARWSYPSLWPGLHASHEAPTPDMPGELIGTTRLLGGFVTPRNSDAGPLWAINGNMGTTYLFTADGLFVATLFGDERRATSWAMPTAQRNMRLNDLTMHGENFWPSITQTGDGGIYLVDGARTSLVRIDGLESIKRIPESTLNISAEDLQKAQASFLEREATRQQSHGQDTLKVPIRAAAPVVDGKLDDWAGAQWVDIDKSGVAAWFNSDSKPHNVSASVAISGDKLYAAFKTDDADLLRNTGEMPTAPFKTGGALDLMIGANPAADPKRAKPVAGDMRLIVTQVKGKTFAVLYRAVVPGTKDPVPFSSPWRTITLDRADDVSAQVTLAANVVKNAKGKVETATYEFSIPLTALNLKPQSGQTLRGDLGILRGDGMKTVHRVYWSNKATGITADVPSEAELTPKLWGKWNVVAE